MGGFHKRRIACDRGAGGMLEKGQIWSFEINRSRKANKKLVEWSERGEKWKKRIPEE